MTSHAVPVLLTSSIIAHDQGVKLKDTGLRLHHAIESVQQWLAIDPNLKLVLCDGSDFDLKSVIGNKFSNTNIEFLKFNNDQSKVYEHGRGYGEAEIIKFALQNSVYINEAGCFAKCSSKLWVKNFNECLEHWHGGLLLKGVFLNVFSPFKKIKLHHIDTRFFIAEKEIYLKYFNQIHHNIDVKVGIGLEECFLQVILKNQMKKILMPISPEILGMGGGTAQYYGSSLKRSLKEKLRILLVKNSTTFKHLF